MAVHPPEKALVLSRFFHNNVKFVANMCPKCYEERDEVKIISFNLHFLKYVDKQFYKELIKYLRTNNESNQEKRLEEVGHNKLEYKPNGNNNKTVIKISYKMFQKMYLRGLKNISKERKVKWKRCYKNFIKKNRDTNEHFKEDSTELKIDKIPNENANNTFANNKNEIKTLISLVKDTSDIKNEVNQLQQTQFISDFLTTNFELQYFHNRKTISDLPESSWIPPKSPHNLIEETLYKDPWALLIATIFLNKTSCVAARPYVFWFLSENPDPLTVLDKFPSDFEKYFVILGLGKTRAIATYRMSHDFLFKPWKSVKQLYGIGDYGECAYRMFCLGDFSVEPKDRFLKIYKAWHQKVCEYS